MESAISQSVASSPAGCATGDIAAACGECNPCAATASAGRRGTTSGGRRQVSPGERTEGEHRDVLVGRGVRTYTPAVSVSHARAPGARPVSIFVPRRYLSTRNAQVRSRRLWGNDVYTEDSDLVAVLVHMGLINPMTPLPPHVVGVLATVEAVSTPPHVFPSVTHAFLRSRERADDGMQAAFRVSHMKLVVGATACTAPGDAGAPIVCTCPTAVTTRLVPDLQFSLSGDLWCGYSVAALGDRAPDRLQWTVTRLCSGESLYLESDNERLEVAVDDARPPPPPGGAVPALCSALLVLSAPSPSPSPAPPTPAGSGTASTPVAVPVSGSTLLVSHIAGARTPSPSPSPSPGGVAALAGMPRAPSALPGAMGAGTMVAGGGGGSAAAPAVAAPDHPCRGGCPRTSTLIVPLGSAVATGSSGAPGAACSPSAPLFRLGRVLRPWERDYDRYCSMEGCGEVHPATVPCNREEVEILGSGLDWSELRWAAHGLCVRGMFWPVDRFQFLCNTLGSAGGSASGSVGVGAAPRQ